MNAHKILGAIALSVLLPAHGAHLPEPAKNDNRIRFATFDAYDVVTIHSKIGIGTTIFFEPDEQVVDMIGGDVDAWGAEVPTRRNGVFLKPAAILPNTNLHVITTKRHYTFELRLAQKGEIPFMTVHFLYPTAKKVVDTERIEADRIQRLLALGTPTENVNYTVQGDGDLAPIAAWDDGRSTFLRFRARGSIPAIYSETGNKDSPEQIESVTVTDDVVQVHSVRRKLVLRVGLRLACVFNEGFNLDDPPPKTNTSSAEVTRVVKGNRK